MASGVEIGTAYLTIQASAKGAVNQINRELGAQLPASGKKAGEHLGGGMLAAARGFVGPLAALFAVDKIKDFFVESNAEARESQKVGAQTAQVIKSTGGAAKITATQVGNLATAISNKTGIDDEQIQSSENMLLTFTNVHNAVGKGNDIFNQATQTVTDMSAALGQDGKSSAIQLGKALNDPVKGITALQRVGVSFTDQQKKQIKAMVKSGDTLGAQKMILKELNKEFGGSAAAQATAGEKMKTAFKNLQEQVGTALLPVIDKLEKWITTKGIPAFSKLVTYVSTHVGPAFKAAKGFIEPIVNVVKRVFASFQNGNAATGFLQTKLIPAFHGIVSAGQKLGAVVLPIVRQILHVLASEWPKIKPIVMGVWKTVGGIVLDVMHAIQITIQRVTKVISFIWSHFGTQIKAIVGSAFLTIFRVIGGVMKVIGGVVKVILGVMTGNWKQAGTGIKMIVTGLKNILFAIWNNIKVVLTNTLGVLIHYLIGKWDQFRDYVGGKLKSGLAAVKDFVLAPVRAARDALKKILDQVAGKFTAGVAAIGRAWDALKDAAKEPIQFVIDTVLNGGLIAAFNQIAKLLPGVSTIPDVAIKGFHDGGYTGAGSKMQPAGIVHADEFVISKSARRQFEARNPGMLDYLNATGTLPGYAGGGLVGGAGRFTDLFASRLLAAEKVLGTTFSIFQRGFRPATSYSGTSHAGDAVDLGPVTANVVAVLRSLGIAAWRRGPAQGFSMRHIHGVPLPGSGSAGGSGVWQAQDYLRGGDGLGGRDYEARGGALGKFAAFIKAGFSSVKDWLANLIKDPLAKLTDLGSSPFAKLVGAVPRLVAEGMLSNAKGFANGGVTPPGWSMVGESGRELIYTPGGSRVVRNRDTERMVGGGSAPAIHQHFPQSLNPAAAASIAGSRVVSALSARGL